MPPINALSLNAKPRHSFWEPDAISLDMAKLLQWQGSGSAAPATAQLEINLDGSTPTVTPPKSRIQISANPRFPNDSDPLLGNRPSSDPPEENGNIAQEAATWAAVNNQGPEEILLLAQLAARIRVAMWDALNLHIESPEAHSIAQQRNITVRLVPEDGSLEKYQVQLAQGGIRQLDDDCVQYQLDTTTGKLQLQDHAPHALWEFGAKYTRRIDTSRSFPSFYRKFRDFTSEGLRGEPLFTNLTPAAQQYLLMDPTVAKRKAALHVPLEVVLSNSDNPAASKLEDEGPTLLVYYFPRIAAGARDATEAFAEQWLVDEDKRSRLHRLVQNILLAVFQRETEDPSLGRQNVLEIWISPNPNDPHKRRLQVLTRNESIGRNIGPEEVLLRLKRWPMFSGDEVYPVIEHEYLNYKKVGKARHPEGMDLKFQRQLGLGDLVRLQIKIPELGFDPPDYAQWEEWMEQNGFRLPSQHNLP
jgi:hypothetical protein